MTKTPRRRNTYETIARHRVLELLEVSVSEDRLLVPAAKRDAVWLRRHVGSDGIVQPERGIFTLEHYWSNLDKRERALRRIKALAKAHPDWAFWGYDAALVWGLDVPFDLLAERYVVGSHAMKLSGCPASVARRDVVGSIEVCDGVPVTSFWRTVEDCLLRAPFSFGLAIADSALRLKGETSAELNRRLCENAWKRHGFRRASAIASYADGRSENGGESRFRAFFIVYGFAIPDLQVSFTDPLNPDMSFRVDYLWQFEDGSRLIGELDGLDKYTIEDDSEEGIVGSFAAERQRESHLTFLGCPVLRFSFDELKNPAELGRKLELAGVPRDAARSEEWRLRWMGKAA